MLRSSMRYISVNEVRWYLSVIAQNNFRNYGWTFDKITFDFCREWSRKDWNLYTKSSISKICLHIFYRHALDTTPSGSTAQFLLYQRYSWRRNSSTASTCLTLRALMSITGLNLGCYFGSCTGAGWPTAITTDVYCTDSDIAVD